MKAYIKSKASSVDNTISIDCHNNFDRMEYQNTCVSGHTWMARNEDDQQALLEDPHNLDVPVFKVEFDVDYTLEFLDDSKENLIMKDFIVTDIKATELIGNDAVDVEITEEEKEAIGLRVIAAIEDNYIETEYYICKALGGNPSDE